MASYAKFHHIELDNIGKRSTPRPVGGKATIFDSSSDSFSETPRRVKDYMKSNPLGIDEVEGGKIESPPRSKQPSPTPTQSSDDVSDTCSEASTASSASTPTKAMINGSSTPRQRVPPGGFSHKLW